MKFILHIGPPKTGTTFIQTHLTRHREELAGYGVSYTRAGTGPQFPYQHHLMMSALRDGQFADASAILDEARQTKADMVIMSAEGLANLPEASVRWLARELGGNAHIVYYHRSWVRALPSNIQEVVRKGDTATVPEILLRQTLRPWQSRIINPAITLDKFAAAFGKDAIQVVSFKQAVTEGLFHHFLSHVVGIKADLSVDNGPAHPSHSPVHMEVLRMAHLLRKTGEIDASGWRWPIFLREATQRGLDHLNEVLAPHVCSLILRGTDRPYSEIYKSVADKYGPAFELEVSPTQYVSPSYLAMPSIVAEMRRVCGLKS